MIKFFLYLTMAAFALACGGDIGNESDEPDQFGTTEEAISIGNGGYGFANTLPGLACAQPGGAGQNCFTNGNTTGVVKYCFESIAGSPFTADSLVGLRAGVTAIDAAVNHYVFQEVALVGAGCILKFQSTAAVNPTVGFSNIDDFALVGAQGLSAVLTSPPGASHVNGTWRSFQTMNVGYAVAKALSQGPLVDRIYGQHVGGNSAGKFIGLGTRTTGDYNSSYMRRFVSVISPPAGLTAGDQCRANALNTSGPTTISATVGCGI